MATKAKKGGGDVVTRRLNIRLTDEALKRLGVHALMNNRKPGQIVSELICDHLREWAIPADLSHHAARKASASSAAPVESAGTVAA
jgi:hypothetical protein